MWRSALATFVALLIFTAVAWAQSLDEGLSRLGSAPRGLASLGITAPKANATAFSLSGLNETGADASSAFSLTGTWNTTGAATGIFENMTCTSCNSARLIDLQASGTSYFRVVPIGGVLANGIAFANQLESLLGPLIIADTNPVNGFLELTSQVALFGTSDEVLQVKSTSGSSFGVFESIANPLALSTTGAGNQISFYPARTLAASINNTFFTLSVPPAFAGTLGAPSILPQGRLSLSSGVAVMTADVTAASQIFYTCYNGGNSVYYFNGTSDLPDTIASCNISMTMATSGTGVTNSGGVFDIWWAHGGASRICVATNGAGGGWASDTGGSNTARGTGYSQLDLTTRPYITNKNAIANCYNGATNYGSLSANQATYLGTITTTAAGQTGMQSQAAAASGGSNAFLGVYNGYNQVTVLSRSQDSTAAWNANAASTWENLDKKNATGGGANNRVTYVDGLATAQAECRVAVAVTTTTTAESDQVGCNLDSTSATPAVIGEVSLAVAGTITAVSIDNFAPKNGLHFLQAMEFAASTTLSTFGNGSGAYAQLQVSVRM